MLERNINRKERKEAKEKMNEYPISNNEFSMMKGKKTVILRTLLALLTKDLMNLHSAFLLVISRDSSKE